MKLVLFAAALMLSGAAIAQETTDTTTTETTTTTTMATAPAAGMTVAPSNANPERDARGIPVISDAAVAPPGVNTGNTIVPPGAVAVPNTAAFTTQPATTNYPPCTRTVTDHCVQTYERGRPH